MKTGYEKSDNVVVRLTAYAVSTGVLTSAASLATLILVCAVDVIRLHGIHHFLDQYNCMPDNFIFMAVYFVVSKRTSSIFPFEMAGTHGIRP